VIAPSQTPPTPEPEESALPPALIVVLRVLLLALAAGAVTAAVVLTAAARSPTTASAARFVCPMHPEVRAAEPGLCPICRMALEPTGPNPAAHPGHAEMPGMADVTAVDNVRKHKIIDFVRMRSLLPDLREIRGAGWVGPDGIITALFYNDQIAALSADEPGAFTLTRGPGTRVAVRRTSDPEVGWDRSTSRLRFRVEGAAGAALRLEPGQVGWVELAPKAREVVGVPASAVLQSPEGPYVLAALPTGGFEKRPIDIGETFLKQGFVVVLSGLRAHDRVVSRAAFFLDADRRLGSHEGDTGWSAP
jgi:Heavy metal binding domain